MAKLSTINVMVDSKDKEEATKILKDCGVSMSGAIAMFLKQIIRVQGIPFDVSARAYYTDEQRKVIEQGEQLLDDIKTGKVK